MKSTFLSDKFNIRRIMGFCGSHKKVVILSAILTVIAVISLCVHSSEKISMNPDELQDVTLVSTSYDNAISDDDIEITYDNSAKPANTAARSTISVEDVGRSDPFLPDGEFAVIKSDRPKPSYDLLPPPETITSDTTATEVMTTKVSGLMYDKTNPSAIININGSDYLVRSGDEVNNYKVLSIDKSSVTVKYGANIYKAGVGELFTGDGINYNTISNLENKFGGSGNSVNKK